jgi:hypothetical protein
VLPLHYISLIKAHQQVGFFLNSALSQSRKATKSYHRLLEISFSNIIKVGTNMALFAFSSFLNTLCSKATDL